MKSYLKIRYFLKRTYKKFFKPHKLNFPEIVSIELSTICNAKCKFCPHSKIMEKDKKRKIVMTEEVFKKIVNNLVGHPELKEIKPNLYNEPSVTPFLFERLRYIRTKIPNVSIKIVTNGAELQPDKIDKLLNENLVDEINFSLDANNKETFEDFKQISWEKTINNLNYFIKKNNGIGHKVKVGVSFVHTIENKGQLPGFKKRWKKKVDKFHIGSEVGLNRRGDYLKKNTSLPCMEPFNRLSFLSDGRAVMCCADAFGQVIVGDIKNKSVNEIWHGPVLEKIRQLHSSGNKRKIPLCSVCNEWG